MEVGLIYIHEGKHRWNLYISRTLNAKIDTFDPEENGITISFSSHGPTDEEIVAAKQFTEAEAREYEFSENTTTVFIPSERKLSQDTSQVRKAYVPLRKPRWLVVSVPFKHEEMHVFATLPPLSMDYIHETTDFI